MTTDRRARAREQTRARYPDEEGYVERDGVRIFYEVYGSGEPTILLLPTWSIIHSRHWKAQIPYLARHARVVTFDGRGNGRSDRPATVEAYAEREFAADALAVMDATGTERAVLVGLSAGALWGVAARRRASRARRRRRVHRARRAVRPARRARDARRSTSRSSPTRAGRKYNRHYWLENYRDFLEFFFGQVFTEPHSTKQIEDCVGWGLETTRETLALTYLGRELHDRDEFAAPVPRGSRARCSSSTAPRTRSGRSSSARSSREVTGGALVALEGSGHCPHARDPVRVNLLLRDFVAPRPAPRALDARPRPAQARALRLLADRARPRPARHRDRARAAPRCTPTSRSTGSPSTRSPRRSRPPASACTRPAAQLANESRHIESESAEHDLHCFQAWRRMDEILVANFMVFHDLVSEQHYDLWIADEGWEIDYYLHENPEQKRAAYAWLTDFVGWLPMPDGGEHEAALTADYNAEMIEHIARYPRVRDRAIFVGNPDDIVPDDVRPRPAGDRRLDRASTSTSPATSPASTRPSSATASGCARSSATAPDEQVCVVTVGGSGVGRSLLERVMAAFPEARRRVPELRMIVVAGPRIDPASLPAHDGLEVRAFVPDLYRHLAACDLAVVQGGLTTSMELTANRRPFLYFPLRHHFEQNIHVRHRLERYGAGRRMDFETATPDVDRRGDRRGDRARGRLPAGRDRRRRRRGRADRRAAVSVTASRRAPPSAPPGGRRRSAAGSC